MIRQGVTGVKTKSVDRLPSCANVVDEKVIIAANKTISFFIAFPFKLSG